MHARCDSCVRSDELCMVSPPFCIPDTRRLSPANAQVIVLRMVKPPSFKAVPGMFIFLNLPCIAKAGAAPHSSSFTRLRQHRPCHA